MIARCWFARRVGFQFRCLPVAIGYRLRRLVIKPAPSDERCIMGAPVHPAVWCPRRSVTTEHGPWLDALFCERHRP